MKVSIKNFQSVEEAEIEINGFTVLVGKSNIGKSAVIRAVQGALINREGEDFVTHGASHTEVELDCPEIKLHWKKGGGHNAYVINGESLESVGRGAPPHIEEAGFGEMKVGRDSINVQVADQFHPLFLLNETGSLAAEAISDVGRLTEVQEALRNAEKDRREVRSTHKVREKDLVDVKARLNDYKDYENDMEQVEEVRTYYREISTLGKELSYLQRTDTKKTALDGLTDQLEGVDLLNIPVWDGDSDLREVEDLERYAQQFERGKAGLQKYAGVEKIEVPEWDDEGLINDIRWLSETVQKTERVLRSLHTFKGLGDVDLPDIDALTVSQDECQVLADYAAKLERIVSQIPSLKKDIGSLDIQIEESKAELHETLHEAGQCPTCERGVS